MFSILYVVAFKLQSGLNFFPPMNGYDTDASLVPFSLQYHFDVAYNDNGSINLPSLLKSITCDVEAYKCSLMFNGQVTARKHFYGPGEGVLRVVALHALFNEDPLLEDELFIHFVEMYIFQCHFRTLSVKHQETITKLATEPQKPPASRPLVSARSNSNFSKEMFFMNSRKGQKN